MKSRIIRRICIVVVALVASSAACFQLGSSWLQPATAQIGDGSVKFISGSSQVVWGLADTQTLRSDVDPVAWQSIGGIVPGQMIRINVASAITPGSIIETGADQSSVRPLSFQCSVFDQNGVRIFQTARRLVPLRGFGSENILFGDLAAVPGEPVTQRKQVRVVVSYFTSAGPQQSTFGSVETIDTTTGKTTTSQGWGPWEVSLTPLLRGGGA